MSEQIPKRTRKTRSDKLPAARKYSRPFTVKMTEAMRAQLTPQAKAAGFESVAKYLRNLATLDRLRLNLPAYDYNSELP